MVSLNFKLCHSPNVECTYLRHQHRRTAKMVSMNDIPNEVLLEITKNDRCISQANYRSYILVNKRFHDLLKFELLPIFPIRITSTEIDSFADFVTTLEMASRIRYLWINAGRKQASHVERVIHACTNLIGLACSKIAFFALCVPRTEGDAFAHTALTELTLFGNRSCWYALNHVPVPHSKALCGQITHLRLQDEVSRDFDAAWFPALTHVGSSLYLGGAGDVKSVELLAALPCLERIVYSTNHWSDEPDAPNEETRDLLEKDPRIRLLFLGADASEFELWCGRAWTRLAFGPRIQEQRAFCDTAHALRRSLQTNNAYIFLGSSDRVCMYSYHCLTQIHVPLAIFCHRYCFCTTHVLTNLPFSYPPIQLPSYNHPDLAYAFSTRVPRQPPARRIRRHHPRGRQPLLPAHVRAQVLT